MRVQDLTKEELRTHLLTSGQLSRLGNTPLWQEAFRRYNGENKSNLKPTCGKCFEPVKKWLEK